MTADLILLLVHLLTYVARTVLQSSCQSMSKHWDQYTVLHADMVECIQL